MCCKLLLVETCSVLTDSAGPLLRRHLGLHHAGEVGGFYNRCFGWFSVLKAKVS